MRTAQRTTIARGLWICALLGLGLAGCASSGAIRESSMPEESPTAPASGATAEPDPALVYGPPLPPGFELKPVPAAARTEPAAGEARGKSSATEVERAIERGLAWLAAKQNADGGFGPLSKPREAAEKGVSDVGLSAFGLYALARAPAAKRAAAAEAIQRGLGYLKPMQQPDGSFCDPLNPALKNYKTSVAVLALAAIDRAKHEPEIARAVAFIRGQQVVDESDLSFGGIGYGGRDTASDISNATFGLEALHTAGESSSSSVYARAQKFLGRVQNDPSNPPIEIGKGEDGKPIYKKSSGDGGFPYRLIDARGPVESLDGGQKVFSSYGSMTYSGLRSFLYAQMPKSDPRVQSAFQWVSRTFTVAENPGMATPKEPQAGQQGLFYYYHTMAKALSIWGEREIVDARGVRHDWAAELGAQIQSLQRADGSWANAADRWMESIPELCTAYALVALSVCHEELAKR